MTKRGERSAGSLVFLLFMIIMLITYLVAQLISPIFEANCRMRLASHWQNKKRHCDVSCIILSDQTKLKYIRENRCLYPLWEWTQKITSTGIGYI